MKFMIDNFGIYNLFGRDNYEYYARISGRVLKVEENWIFAFKYPPENVIPSTYPCFTRLLDLLLVPPPPPTSPPPPHPRPPTSQTPSQTPITTTSTTTPTSTPKIPTATTPSLTRR